MGIIIYNIIENNRVKHLENSGIYVYMQDGV